MTTLHETITVPRKPREVFAYLSDFSTCQEWDETVLCARRLSPGPLGEGTRFEVVCKLPVGSVRLDYTLEVYEPHKRLQLRGTCVWFTVIDTIVMTKQGKGTHIDYQAVFTFNALADPIFSRAQSGMAAMGRRAVAGLQRALEDEFTIPEPSRRTRIADRTVLPGVSLFSALGYKLARKRFNPVSAYLGDKHIVITGASSGLGYATAKALARRGAALTLVMRDEQRAEDTVAALIADSGNDDIRAELADLSEMADVDALVRRMKRRPRPIDVLINNAGALFNPREETSEGLEKSFALLLLSPYRLTLGLKKSLQKSADPRVINVVSGGMYTQKLSIDALNRKEDDDYSGSVAYARAKRALMVVTQQWAEAWAEDGIAVNAMHPGWADTPGVREALPEFRALTRGVLRDAKQGADTIVWLAAATEASSVSGKLFLDRTIHSPHLLRRTQEAPGVADELITYLDTFS